MPSPAAGTTIQRPDLGAILMEYALEQSRTLLKAHKELAQKVATFRQALSPDDRLRNLVFQGRCDLCPG